MRIWYVVDGVEYWLEPEFTVNKADRLTIEGARLYSSVGIYKGWWEYRTWPTVVRRTVHEAVREHLRRKSNAERLERVRTKSMISKTK